MEFYEPHIPRYTLILQLAVPDETYQKYTEAAPGKARELILKAIDSYAGAPPGARQLVFSREEIGELEKVTGKTVETAHELIDLLKRLSTMKVDTVEVSITARQAKALEAQAGFWRKPVPEYLKEKAAAGLKAQLGGY